MSDYNPFVGDDGPPEGSPDEVGVATGDGQPTEPAAVSKAYLDVDEVADHHVRLKVDGEELEVPLKEALQGYSRTADYTRKTQELAAQRQQAEFGIAVQRALQAQPEETLRLLSRQYGINLGQSPPPQQGWEQPSIDDGPEDDQYLDPLERRVNEQDRLIRQMSSSLSQREAREALQVAIGGLQRKYQLDEATVREVVGTALQGHMGPESFEMIYKNIAFDRAQEGRRQAMQQRQARDAQREQAKASGQQLIGSGSSANGAGGAMPGPSDGRMSIEEAFEAAERELGVRF